MAKAKGCKAFLIDPENHEIKEVEYTGHYENIYTHIRCDTFDCVRLNGQGDGVFVDDNGLLTNPHYFFFIKGCASPLAGCGLVLGVDRQGESVAPKKITLEWLKENTGFVDRIGAGVIAVQAPASMTAEVQSFFM